MRNYAVFHSFVPLRSVLGLQLWLGNNDQYQDHFPGWLHPIDNSVERAKYVRIGEMAYMDEKRREAIHWMVTHPWREVQLFAQRFTATWLGTTHPMRDFLSSHFFFGSRSFRVRIFWRRSAVPSLESSSSIGIA